MSAKTSAAELHSSEEPASLSTHINSTRLADVLLARHSRLVCKHHLPDKAEASPSIGSGTLLTLSPLLCFSASYSMTTKKVEGGVHAPFFE